MPITCPHCQNDVHLDMTAVIPDQQTLSIVIEFEGTFLVAETLAKVIANTEKTLKAIAKDMGERIAVFIKAIDYAPTASPAYARVTFLIARLSKLISSRKGNHETHR